MNEILKNLNLKALNFSDGHSLSQLVGLINECHRSLEDGKLTVVESTKLLGMLLEFGTHAKDTFDNPAAHVDDIAGDLLEIYDKLIAPIDIPYIPNFLIEPKVDAMFRALIIPATYALLSRID